jgi:hypothetical protein
VGVVDENEDSSMKKEFRYLLYLVCLIQLIFAAGFFWQLPFAVNWWLLTGTTPLTFTFIASIFAAAAASTFWTVASRNDGALAGIGLDYLFILGPISIYFFLLSNTYESGLMGLALVLGLGALFGLGSFWWAVRMPLGEMPALPHPIRWSFLTFVLGLILVSVRLIIKRPNVVPWIVTPEISVVIGWIFFGAAIYFAYTLFKPSWHNAAGQLMGFLAYDLVLLPPFMGKLPTIAPEHRTSMIIYIVVMLFSGSLATYYLFIHKPTRILF